jgi:hypothetical protein
MVGDLLYGDLDGPKAGPLRWLLRPRDMLPDVWEFAAFASKPWMQALLVAAGRKAAMDFPDREVWNAPRAVLKILLELKRIRLST